MRRLTSWSPFGYSYRGMIYIKTKDEIEIMRRSNRIVAQILWKLKEMIRPGITTRELDKVAERSIREAGGTPAFKGYRGYPNTLCASVNEEVVHGIPGPRRLKEGEIVSLDLGIYLDGYYGDAAITVPVGEVNQEAAKLMVVTQQALHQGIEQAKDGNRLLDISHAIQSYVESAGFSVVREFVGHGIGHSLHEDPQVPNFGPPHHGPRLKSGMVLAIEPMINVGTWEVRVLTDGWTVVTADGSLSAHFEHTIAITDGEPNILSLP